MTVVMVPLTLTMMMERKKLESMKVLSDQWRLLVVHPVVQIGMVLGIVIETDLWIDLEIDPGREIVKEVVFELVLEMEIGTEMLEFVIVTTISINVIHPIPNLDEEIK